MRNKFKELIERGIASFNYTPITSDKPDTDPICRMYNNIFSIPSDTHMSVTADGERVITGHMINTDLWAKFCCACSWGAMTFKTTGYWSLGDFLYKHNLTGKLSILNGDVVYKVFDAGNGSTEDGCEDCMCKCPCPSHCTANESQIPLPITSLTISGNKMHITECFNCEPNKIAQKLNESTWIKGSNWAQYENVVIGLVGDDVYKINLN